MKIDTTTKILLALIALGLFANAANGITQTALAYESVYISGGTVSVNNPASSRSALRVTNAGNYLHKEPLLVECVKGCN